MTREREGKRERERGGDGGGQTSWRQSTCALEAFHASSITCVTVRRQASGFGVQGIRCETKGAGFGV